MRLPETQTFSWKASCKIVKPGLATDGNSDPGFGGKDARAALTSGLDILQDLIARDTDFCIDSTGPSPIKPQPAPGLTGRRIFHCRTSGSTGTPKIIRRSHRSWRDSFEVNRRLFDFDEQDTFAVFGSLAHSLTLYGMLEAAHIGADVCTLAHVRPDRQRAELERLKASVLYLTPTQLGLLCRHQSAPAPLRAVRQILFGGGRPAPSLLGNASLMFPNANIVQFYGASETSFIAISDKTTPLGSVGRAYPGVKISIRGANGEPCDGTGEIWVKSPYLFDGYAEGQSNETKWQDGFVSVGELGRLDAKGNLFVEGRQSRMVTIADQNVFPEEVETFLATLLDARQITVVAQGDAVRGNRLIAVVEGAAEKYDVEGILRRCRQSLGPLAAPRALHFIHDLPMLSAGKPDLVAICAWLETQT